MFLKFGENPVIVASTAEAAKEIMKTHDSIFCTRPLSSTVKAASKHGGMGIVFAPYGDHWRQMRKICSLELLSAKRISSSRPVREEEAIRLIQSVSSASESDEQLVNLSKMLAAYVTDTAVHTITGRRFKEHDTFLRYLDEAVRLVDGFSLPDLFPSSRLARSLSGKMRQVDAFVESMRVFMGRVIDNHLETKNSSGQEDLIDVLLRIQGEGNLEFPLTMSSIKAVIWDLLSGGTEIATTTLQWAMAELMRNPSVMSKAQAEVRAAFMGQMKVSEDGLSKLSYLQCVLKETLRLHTPGPLLIPRECREDCKILGYDVPKGTTAIVNAWAICRDPECWDEPEAFAPERFMGSTRDYKGNNFEFIPFGAGRRSCPGMLFGIANMQLALASLLFY